MFWSRVYCSVPVEMMFVVTEAIVIHCERKKISLSDLLSYDFATRSHPNVT
jgi:hypothetical protein